MNLSAFRFHWTRKTHFFAPSVSRTLTFIRYNGRERAATQNFFPSFFPHFTTKKENKNTKKIIANRELCKIFFIFLKKKSKLSLVKSESRWIGSGKDSTLKRLHCESLNLRFPASFPDRWPWSWFIEASGCFFTPDAWHSRSFSFFNFLLLSRRWVAGRAHVDARPATPSSPLLYRNLCFP